MTDIDLRLESICQFFLCLRRVEVMTTILFVYTTRVSHTVSSIVRCDVARSSPDLVPHPCCFKMTISW